MQIIYNVQLSYARVKNSAWGTRQPLPGLRCQEAEGRPIDGFTPVPSISVFP